jgi:transcriptional regulator with XRE-family HTH domain
MEPRQCRAARGLLQWTQSELAKQAGVSNVTVRGFENEQTTPLRATLDVMRRAFERAGVEFNADGRGVRLSPDPKGRRK